MNTDEINSVLEGANYAELIAWDTETTGIDRIKDGRDYLTGISLAYDGGGIVYSCYLPFRHREGNLSIPEYLPRVTRLLATKPNVWHNRKFDRHSLKTIGITEFHPEQYDTMMEAHLVNEEWYSKELDYLGKMLIGEGKDKDEVKEWARLFGWDTVPVSIMEPYARKDAVVTLKIHQVLWERMKGQDLVKLWDTERDFTDALYNMEQTGIGVNADFCDRKAEYGTRRMDTLKRELGFNPGSVNDLREFFFTELNMPVLEYTPKGQPALTKKVLEEYDALLAVSNTRAARLVLEYRGWQKAVSSLYLPMLNLVSPDGRIRTNFKQHGTKTGRLSSAGPNLQQIPRKSEHLWNGDSKLSFTAPEGYELWGWDYSQLELRLGTAYGRDSWLLRVFSDPDADVFTAMSERLGIPRQTCKTYTYANLYGAGLEKIAYTLGQRPQDIESDYYAFLESIAGMKEASREATRLAKQRGYVRYWTGRRRHFMDRDSDAHKSFNSILQGGAAELVKRAQLRCADLEGDACRMVLQVHDEIVFAIAKGQKDTYEPEIVERMVDFPEFGVPLKVEGKVWNDVQERELVAA